MSNLLQKLLEAKQELESLDKIFANGWDYTADDGKGGWTVEDSKGWHASAMVDALKRALLHTVPPGFVYRIGFAMFNTTDPHGVRVRMLEHAWTTSRMVGESATDDNPNKVWIEGTLDSSKRDPGQKMSGISIHEESHDGKEIFSVGAAVFPCYGSAAIVKTAIVVVYPQEGVRVSKKPGASRRGKGGGGGAGDEQDDSGGMTSSGAMAGGEVSGGGGPAGNTGMMMRDDVTSTTGARALGGEDNVYITGDGATAASLLMSQQRQVLMNAGFASAAGDLDDGEMYQQRLLMQGDVLDGDFYAADADV
jgi:hypothetical protein